MERGMDDSMTLTRSPCSQTIAFLRCSTPWVLYHFALHWKDVFAGCNLLSPVIPGSFRYVVRMVSSPLDKYQYQLGCSIWGVELLRREILKLDPETKVNAILIDFLLYDLAKERERDGKESIPHHRTRSIWY
jgi:hypothetical protein